MPFPTQPATALNSEAGDHPVTADPRLLRACATAVERTYAAFPYYEERYGARGRAFSSSDSGWLMTVAELEPDEAVSEVAWLARVLAGRGMPRLLIECHLGHLADELAVDGDEALAPLVEGLRGCAEDLRRRREASCPPQEARSLAEGFESAAPAAERERLPRTGELLAAAVADERDGIARALPSLVDWLSDADRFSPAWVAAVDRLVATGRGGT